MALRLKWTASIVTVLLAFVDVTDCVLGRCFSCPSTPHEPHEPDPYQCILGFRRGQFERIKWAVESREENLSQKEYSVRTSAGIGKEITCNDAFYMLSYLHMTNPKHYDDTDQVFSIHERINQSYPGWATEMLATAFNVAQNEGELQVPWLMYLYVNWIEERTAKDTKAGFLPYMQAANDGMYETVKTMMRENDCTMYPDDESEMKLHDFEAGITGWRPNDNYKDNYADVSRLMRKHWHELEVNSGLHCFQEAIDASGPVQGVRPVTKDHLTVRQLYLNDVFVDRGPGTELLTKFNVLDNAVGFDNYLKKTTDQIRNGRTTSFRKYVESLALVQEYLRVALGTMRLRILYHFLAMLETLKQRYWLPQIEKFLIPYNALCVFLHLPTNNDVYLIYYKLKYPRKVYTTAAEVLLNQKDLAMKKLKDTKYATHINSDNEELDNLQNIHIDGIWLEETAHEHKIWFDSTLITPLEYPTNKAILCTVVFVGYVNILFDNIHFKALNSLAKLKTSTSERLEQLPKEPK